MGGQEPPAGGRRNPSARSYSEDVDESPAAHRELSAHVAPLLELASARFDDPHIQAALSAVNERLDGPLRIAIAGKVKAGKSTLLNALVGEELAPTDAGECTQVVTWYRDGLSYRVEMEDDDGLMSPLPFTRKDHQALHIELPAGQRLPRSLRVTWPSQALRKVTLIDTPGISSAGSEGGLRTNDFLNPTHELPTQADAVIYLMNHVHGDDVRFLEAFHDQQVSQATPSTTVGILSRADEIGGGRQDALAAADRVAARYRADPRVRSLCHTVVPVAGLLAQSSTNLRQRDYDTIARLAAHSGEAVQDALLSADRLRAAHQLGLTAQEREQILERFGMFGVRIGTQLIRRGQVRDAGQLARELRRQSGVDDLVALVENHFVGRAPLLRARSAVVLLEALIASQPGSTTRPIALGLDQLYAKAHPLAELRALTALRDPKLALDLEERTEAERICGAYGFTALARMGLDADLDSADIAPLLVATINRWRRKAEHPLSPVDVRAVSHVVIRSCEELVRDLPASD
jgi:hypothetical protein